MPIISLLLIVLGSSSMASLNVNTPNGRIFTDLYVPTQSQFPDKPFEQMSISTWLEVDPQMSESMTSKFIYQGDGFDGQYSSTSGVSNGTHLESRLREGYISYSDQGWDIKLGEQIIPWGKSDVINPTDFNSAKNFTFFNPDDEVKRVSSFTLQVMHTPKMRDSPLTITALWTPIFARSKLLFPPMLVPGGITVSDPQSPPVKIENSEGALKLAYTGQAWDFSLSGFSGYSHMPELQLVTPINLTQVYRNIWAIGSDGSYSTEKWIFRGESAFTQTTNADGTNPLIEPSHWDTVLGGERSLGGDFRFQSQFIFRYFPNYTSPSQAVGIANQLVATSNSILVQYQNQSRPGGTLRLSYSDEKKGWDAEIFFLENFSGGDYLLRPKISYSWTDLLKTTLGVEYYGGPGDQTLGALNPYSSVFGEAKYTF